jgi:hypothetical protein
LRPASSEIDAVFQFVTDRGLAEFIAPPRASVVDLLRTT